MSINPIRHFALTHWGSVHDEEALTALELQARSTAKINEAVDVINKQINIINTALDEIPAIAESVIDDSIQDGTISDMLNGTLMAALRRDIDALDNRVASIIANLNDTNGNSELVDARTDGTGKTHISLGNHVRALGNGSAFSDAVRPGTVNAGRIMAGMTGGDLRDKYTVRESIPMAGHWIGGKGYHDMNSLEFVSHDGYTMTDLIPCTYGDTFLIESTVYGNLVKPCVLFNSKKQAVQVLGTAGSGAYELVQDEIHVGRGDVAYVSFICSSPYLSDCKVQRVSMKEATDREVYGTGKGYIHARAKKRTDTITDRAQVKVWFKLPADHTADRVYHIPMQLLRYTNLAGWTLRLFAAASDSSYEMQLTNSASGYTFTTYGGIRPYFKVPLETSDGLPVTHVCLFVDLLPAREDEHINAYLCPMSLYWDGGSSVGDGYALHGHLDTDTLNRVWPGAASSPLYNKRILGIGDSLMSGNNLRKEKTWFNLAAGARDMLHYNAAVNGRPVAGDDSMVSNIDAILEAFPAPDYAIIQGGANDLRLNVPLDDFRAGLHTLAEKVLTSNPRCKILFATNWRRSDYVNPLGFDEDDYVSAMLEEAEAMRIPVVNNFAKGVNLTDPIVSPWADEGIVSGGDANIHFSEAANEYIVPTYINALEGI